MKKLGIIIAFDFWGIIIALIGGSNGYGCYLSIQVRKGRAHSGYLIMLAGYKGQHWGRVADLIQLQTLGVAGEPRSIGGSKLFNSWPTDKHYLKYRWQPSSCNIPRFNGSDFLLKSKGKKIMFIGDSLALNQFISLNCLLHASVPTPKYTRTKEGMLTTVKYEEHDVTVLLYHSKYLVDMVQQDAGLVLKLDSIEEGKNWLGMDVLIFGTWHWWIHVGKSQPWTMIQDGPNLIKDMDRVGAFSRGLATWAKWVDLNIDPSKTKLFFQGITPVHYQGKDWNSTAPNCKDETVPVPGSQYPKGVPPEQVALTNALSRLQKPVYLLDILLLSQLRKDGHPSTYSGNLGTDCSHWCVPGVPDTWNEILSVALV